MFQTEVTAATTITPVFLNKSAIPLAVQFIDAVRATQPDQSKHHLKPKEQDDFHTAMDNGGALLGAHNDNGDIVAFALANPSQDGVCKIESVCVDETLRGHKLGQKLLSLAADWATANQFGTLRAKVAMDNGKSQSLFTGQGFHKIYEGYDQDGNYAYCLFERHL